MVGLSPEQLRDLHDARSRARKVRRAVFVATFGGWATGIFAALTLLGALFGSVAAVALGMGMAVVALGEFRGAARLRRLDSSAAVMLGVNQLFLAALLLGYAGYSLWHLHHGGGSLARQLAEYPELGAYALDVTELERLIGWCVYGTVAAVAIFGQGSTALFYFSRRKHLERYASETPKWILDAQRAGLPM